MHQTAVPFQTILFVCTNMRDTGACCAQRDSVAIRKALKTAVKTRGLSHHIRVSQSGCQDRCAEGPNVMVFPAYRWYSHVTLADVPQILKESIGEPPA